MTDQVKRKISDARVSEGLLKAVAHVLGEQRDATDAAIAKITEKLDGAQSELQENLTIAIRIERSAVDARLTKMQDQLDSIDGTVLLKSASAAIMEAGLAALVGYCDSLQLRKSVKVRGELPVLVKGLVD
jgi:hypothetical protein